MDCCSVTVARAATAVPASLLRTPTRRRATPVNGEDGADGDTFAPNGGPGTFGGEPGGAGEPGSPGEGGANPDVA